MIVPLGDEYLLIRGGHSFCVVGRALAVFPLCIETSHEEVVQGVEQGDLIVASAPEGGLIRPALMLIELVRTFRMPLMVMNRGHPGSARLRFIVSAGPYVSLSCAIERGTHPDQHLLCGSDELSGINLSGTVQGVQLTGLSAGVSYEILERLPVTDVDLPMTGPLSAERKQQL
ncbi:hypothetical protein [Methanosphaerula palustris]|uniref:Uncharacterized protein n=1 Tax=Methanosphaerula palustris (strain ATCC BAA-1556 / DSM 19958 / E1-9c) TaxID=521011 RepID=B8GFR5_METPE|nr:hypothetical protein [Methanosphaerula palustris]ACL17948.1 conserved hypothetical protein [Methanosphaerula palustris E1-9c]